MAVQDLRTRLEALSRNLCWSWNQELDRIFRLIDLDLWRRVNHNPIAFLQDIDGEVLSSKEHDPYLLAQVLRVETALDKYLHADLHWAEYHAPGLVASPVAYFSPEFAIHEALPTYSGGLGVLAGDHLKSCSDLGIPAWGVTLLYRQGYFTQQLDEVGAQSEVYRELDTRRVALEQATRDGALLTVTVPLGDRKVVADVWLAHVGRCKMVLLDVGDAGRTAGYSPRLYGGDRTTRIVQEIVLGVGGYRALRALGVRPGVMHLNEGHSSFAVLEAIAHLMDATGRPFAPVAEEVGESVVFTTHTPIEAGHDRFSPEMVTQFFRPLRKRLGLSEHEFLALGRVDPNNGGEEFCMTVLALKLARRSNAVSSLHGLVSRRMWRPLWPARRTADVPISHITNGAHVDTWLATELGQLYGDYLGHDWRQAVTNPERWRRIERLDASHLFSIKVALKRRLLDFMMRRLEARSARLGLTQPLPQFRADVLTVGFARRFAAYKRALILFEDLDRAKRLLTNPERPVQVIFAGKAHPADEHGKSFIHRLCEVASDPELRDHVIVLEDHDMNVSRHLLEGCDLWLNAPRRPMEACGTSGMKAVFNGTLNCSTLDGWWDEAYDSTNGFAYGEGLSHADPQVQDRRDAEALMNVLETQVVPTFYDRDATGVPARWLNIVKRALSTLAWRYNSDRMVMDYTRRLYLSASKTLTAESPSSEW